MIDLNLLDGVTRFNVHVVAHQHGEQLAATIASVSKLVDESKIKSDYKDYYKKISIYYAFYKRDKDLSLKYLKLYQACCESAKEKAEALSLIAYVQTIDPNFVDEDNLFSQVVQTLEALPVSEQDDNTEITKALAKQYQGMIIHRRACFKMAINSNTDEAIRIIDEAIAIQRRLLESFPRIKIGLAESLHLKAVTLFRLGNIASVEVEKHLSFKLTEGLFSEAARLEEKFCEETEAPHFLIATTLQSFARLLKTVGRSSETHAQYRRALEIQEMIFGKGPHEDKAKTLHFWAETYDKENNHAEAVRVFFSALLMKFKINYSNPSITKETETALLDSLQKLEKSDSQQALAACKNILADLESPENQKQFKISVESFVGVITAIIARLMDTHALQRSPAGSPTRMHASSGASANVAALQQAGAATTQDAATAQVAQLGKTS